MHPYAQYAPKYYLSICQGGTLYEVGRHGRSPRLNPPLPKGRSKWLSHNFPIAFPSLSNNFSHHFSHNFPTTFPSLSHHFPITFPSLSHHFPTTSPSLYLGKKSKSDARRSKKR